MLVATEARLGLVEGPLQGDESGFVDRVVCWPADDGAPWGPDDLPEPAGSGEVEGDICSWDAVPRDLTYKVLYADRGTEGWGVDVRVDGD